MRKDFTGSLSLLAAVACFGAGVFAAEAPDDRGIAAEVRERIADRLPDNAASIQVQARDAEVVLTGEVDLLAKRDIARDAAETVRGASRVDNRITVRAERRPDGIVAVEVKNSLATGAIAASRNIDVSAEGGVVTLRGLVDSVAQKQQAEWIASQQRGVAEVRNELRVTPATATDEALKANLAAEFARDPVLADNALSVAVCEGAVVLTGTVDTLWEKRRAERAAWAPGVVYVDASKLNVANPAPGGRPSRSDEEIRRDLRAAVAGNAALANNDLQPEIRHGEVALTGAVDSYFEKTVAEDLVRHIPGVNRVTNRLTVRGLDFVERADPYHVPGWTAPPVPITPGQSPQEADAKLKAAIERAFAADPRLMGEKIEVSVERGFVTLRGPVETTPKRTAAIGVAREAGARVVKPEFGPGLPR